MQVHFVHRILTLQAVKSWIRKILTFWKSTPHQVASQADLAGLCVPATGRQSCGPAIRAATTRDRRCDPGVSAKEDTPKRPWAFLTFRSLWTFWTSNTKKMVSFTHSKHYTHLSWTLGAWSSSLERDGSHPLDVISLPLGTSWRIGDFSYKTCPTTFPCRDPSQWTQAVTAFAKMCPAATPHSRGDSWAGQASSRFRDSWTRTLGSLPERRLQTANLLQWLCRSRLIYLIFSWLCTRIYKAQHLGLAHLQRKQAIRIKTCVKQDLNQPWYSTAVAKARAQCKKKSILDGLAWGEPW